MGRVFFMTRAGNSVSSVSLSTVRGTGVGYTRGLFGAVSGDGMECRGMATCRSLVSRVGTVI